MTTKLVLGKGIYSKGKYSAKIDGKITKVYSVWSNMLTRCYSEKYHIKQPTYIGCSVAEEWLGFQIFADWYSNHPYSDLGYQLDKDLLFDENKVYSPKTCRFVPRALNSLLNDSKATRGGLPQGVTFLKQSLKYKATINIRGKAVHLGYFKSSSEAYLAYKAAKERYVKDVALEWADRIEKDVFNALMNWRL